MVRFNQYGEVMIETAEELKCYHEALMEDCKPIAEDLWALGFPVKLISYVHYRDMSMEEYSPLFDLIVKHFYLDYMPATRESLAFALACRGAYSLVWPYMLTALSKEKMLRVRAALVSSISEVARPQDLDTVIQLLKDRDLGSSRILLTPVLSRSRQPRAMDVLYSLRDDPDLKTEIANILHRKSRYAAKKAEKDAAKKASDAQK